LPKTIRHLANGVKEWKKSFNDINESKDDVDEKIKKEK
jgi:Sec-independent protein translocase protein TatA